MMPTLKKFKAQNLPAFYLYQLSLHYFAFLKASFKHASGIIVKLLPTILIKIIILKNLDISAKIGPI